MSHEKKNSSLVFMPVLFFVVFYIRMIFSKETNNCDMTRYSNDFEAKNGTIQSPNWPDFYGSNLRCVYRLIALPHERVRVKFTKFEVKGVPPRCLHDYVDVYTQARDPMADLLEVPLHGPYCGSSLDLLPGLFVSMHNVLIVGFYSDHTKEERGFQAEYVFVDGSAYSVGTPAPGSACGQTVRGSLVPSGTLLSPTYPGVYPDNVVCFYRLLGVVGQRVRLILLEMDLYSGGEHCPYDYIRAYDGADNTASQIGTYCGRSANVSLYSTAENLYLEFVTKSGRGESTKLSGALVGGGGREGGGGLAGRVDSSGGYHRGFRAAFSISNEFVDLRFVLGEHVRGTECDQLVLSTGESSGTITSPNYPSNYPLNVACHYYVDGLVDTQNLEKAKLTFDKFDVPKIRDSCTNGYLSAFLHGQDILTHPPDSIICGQEAPPPLVTSHPRLLLIFNTTGARYTGSGFVARYQFLTDYAIPGTPATVGARCHFLYRSETAKHGTFNTPRHPSNYPDNTSCVYEFFGLPNEQVRITFESFKVEDHRNDCSTDYVLVYNIGPPPPPPFTRSSPIFLPDSRSAPNTTATLIGRHCREHLPGPQLSDENASSLRVHFVSNHESVSTGFRARYEFIERKPFSKRCFFDITSGHSGEILSPNHPHKYLINSTCEWHIYASSPRSRISLVFDMFSMEGQKQDKGGCGNAVLKVYANSSSLPSDELCGTHKAGDEILSQEHFLRLKFISSTRAVGAKGFKFIWTEVLSISPHDHEGVSSCSGFHCHITGYCLDASLRCDKVHNCGKDDFSDEALEECGTYRDHGLLHLILGVVVGLVLLVCVLVCVLHRRRRSRLLQQHRQHAKDKDRQELEVRYVTRAQSGAARGGSLSRGGSVGSGGGAGGTGGRSGDKLLLREKTEKVSIV